MAGIKFSSRLDNRIPEFKARFAKASQENLLDATIQWHAGVVEDKLTGSRSGRIYRVPGTQKEYQASAPGEAPASRTGTLRTGYRFRIVNSKGTYTGEVGSPEDYALWLEIGTSKMAPRPHLIPAFESRRPQIQAALSRRVD
jgi:hypothetical protein